MSGQPMPDIVWLLNGKKVEASKNLRFEVDGNTFRLIIPNVKMENAGKVTVQASNKAGTEECSAELTINIKGTNTSNHQSHNYTVNMSL